MKIKKINTFFRKMAELQIRFRWPLLAVTFLLTAFSIAGLKYVEMANSRDSWFDEKEAIEIATERFEDQFGNNDNIAVLIESDDIFDPEVLGMMKALGEELLDSVPYADEVTSLVDMEISVGTQEGIEVINPFEDGIPTDKQKLEDIRRLVLSRQSLKGKLISEDCTEAWLTLSLLEYPEEEEWQEETNIDPMFQDGEAALRILTNPKWKSDKYTLKPVGMPYTETEERNFFGLEIMTRILSGFIVMVILLAFFIRSFRGVVVPAVTTLLGIVVVFGMMGWFGIGVEQTMMMLPVMLGMALSVGYSIHLVNAFKRVFRINGNRKESVIEAVEEVGWPLFFTAVTTMGSVLSFVTAGILTISWVGYCCAALVLTDYLFVIILIPIFMSFGKDREATENEKHKIPVIEKWMESLGHFVLKNTKPILVVFAACLLVVAPGIRNVTVNMDMFRFMGTKVPYIKRVFDVTQSQLGSYLTYNITVSFDEPDAIKNPEALKNFDALLDTVAGFELTKSNENSASIFSILDIIKEMNQTLHSDSLLYHTIPNNSDMVAQVLLLYEMSGGTKTFNWIDEDYSMLRAQVQVEKFDANEIVDELEIVKRFGDEHFEGASVDIVGSAVQFAELNKKLVSGELKSVIWALVIIAGLLVIVFSSFKTGLIGLIPNLMPLVAIGGYMGHFNSPLDMMTMTILPMLLGIAVDDTIHFINHIKYEFEKCGNYKNAIVTAFHTIGKNLAMTTIILCATFGMFLFSPISAMGRIGYLSMLGLSVALLTDLFVTPALIYLTKPFGKEKHE